MALHFESSEFRQRIAAAIAAMQKANLDGLLMFQQESMYYLTGYDTFGFCFFQCLYLGADGKLALLHFGKSIPCLRKHTRGEGASCGKQCLALFLNRERKMLALCLECFHLRSQSG